MRVNFDKFKGSLPYASELFGVYQPLLGWRSKRVKERFVAGARSFRQELIAYVSSKMYPDVRTRERDPDRGLTLDRLGVGGLALDQRSGLHPQVDSLIGRQVLAALQGERPDLDSEATWKKLVSRPVLEAALDKVKSTLPATVALPSAGIRPASAFLGTAAASATQTGALEQAARRESVVAGTLAYLYENRMFATLKEIFGVAPAVADLADYAAMRDFVDPLARFDPRTDLHRVALSPVGIVHLFRQYFFEFDTFLGPPVQHIWLSPGATAELIEIHNRRTIVERQIEESFESTTKSEKAITEEDEISDAVRKENQESTKFGVSTNVEAGVNYEVFTAHASVSANLALENNERRAREQIHKQTRQQSTKLATEIKRNYKSTFKTITEVQDTTSKRYVLTNQTDQLINYELRRKLRQVGVQLQDIGTRLCWQAYVDDPGRDLGVALLVHVAEPADLSSLKQPEAPTQLETQYVDLQIAFAYENVSGSDEKDVTFFQGSDRESWPDHNDRIVWIREYQADPPDHGYVLHEHIDVASLHTSTCVPVTRKLGDDGKFEIRLEQVNFDDQSSVNLKVRLRWEPPDQAAAMAKFLTDQGNYDREKERLTREAYVAAARERIKLASNIEPRVSGELREEERIAVYRKLIGALLQVGVNLENARTRHLTAELINSMFDVDAMLYFVAPEWWRPRFNESHQFFGSAEASGRAEGTTRITDENLVTWGGAGEARPDNYYITEESRPARLGSSLGWLLQLDGDNLRNAFLNAPWVKAVIPIRQGRELAAINWLTHAAIEGTDGLNAQYQAASNQELRAIVRVLRQHAWEDPADQARYGPGFGTADVTVGDALRYLALVVAQKNEEANAKRDENVDGEVRSYLPPDKVYEHGFNPLQGGFQAQSGESFAVFDQWIEVLPTDQIVAVEVKYDPLTGFQIPPP